MRKKKWEGGLHNLIFGLHEKEYDDVKIAKELACCVRTVRNHLRDLNKRKTLDIKSRLKNLFDQGLNVKVAVSEVNTTLTYGYTIKSEWNKLQQGRRKRKYVYRTRNDFPMSSQVTDLNHTIAALEKRMGLATNPDAINYNLRSLETYKKELERLKEAEDVERIKKTAI